MFMLDILKAGTPDGKCQDQAKVGLASNTKERQGLVGSRQSSESRSN